MSNNKVKEIEIGDKFYRLKRLDAVSSLQLQVRLTKLLGGIGGLDIGTLSKGDANTLTSLLSALSAVDAKEFTSIIVEICESTQVEDGTWHKVEFNLEFEDNLLNAYQLAFEFLKFEYANFIDALRQKFTVTVPAKA